MSWLSTLVQSMSQPFRWWVVVAPWEQGLRVRLGKRSRRLDPGIHLRIPFLDRVYVVSTRARVASQDGQTVTTLDGETLTLAIFVRYGIADVQRLFQAIARPEQTLLASVRAAVAGYVSERRKDEITFRGVQEHVRETVRTGEWGLEDVQASVTTFAFVKTYRLLMNSYRDTTQLDHQMDEKPIR